MKFDLSSLIITVIALATFIVPITYDQLNKRKTSKVIKKLTAFAGKQKLQLDKSVVFQDTFALGLDKKLKTLAYLNTNQDKSQESTYDLSKVSKCRLHRSEVNEKDSDIQKIGFIKLQFHNSKTQDVDLEVYKMKQNLAYYEEENMAKKMVRSINTLCS